jgi:hypothetical protein
MEAPRSFRYTLGDLFAIWGVRFGAGTLGALQDDGGNRVSSGSTPPGSSSPTPPDTCSPTARTSPSATAPRAPSRTRPTPTCSNRSWPARAHFSAQPARRSSRRAASPPHAHRRLRHPAPMPIRPPMKQQPDSTQLSGSAAVPRLGSLVKKRVTSRKRAALWTRPLSACRVTRGSGRSLDRRLAGRPCAHS